MNSTPRSITRQQVSAAIAQLMPNIIRGVQLEFFVQRGVTQTQFLVLMSIHAYGQCTMGTLARNMHVSMPTASGVVARLARAGYVRRVDQPSDRRQVLVELTGYGQRFIREFQGVIQRRWEEVLNALSKQELATFYRVVQTLQAQLQVARSED